jgi:hypothetical protein
VNGKEREEGRGKIRPSGKLKPQIHFNKPTTIEKRIKSEWNFETKLNYHVHEQFITQA